MSSRRLKNVFKTSKRHLQDVLQRCLQHVFKKYHQVKLFLLSRFQDIFETYSKRFWDVQQKRLSIKGFVYVSLLRNFDKSLTKVSQILVSHFTTPFSSCLQRRIWCSTGDYYGNFFAKILNDFKLLTFFAKKLHRRCSTGLKIGFWLRV